MPGQILSRASCEEDRLRGAMGQKNRQHDATFNLPETANAEQAKIRCIAKPDSHHCNSIVIIVTSSITTALVTVTRATNWSWCACTIHRLALQTGKERVSTARRASRTRNRIGNLSWQLAGWLQASAASCLEFSVQT